MHQNSNFTVTFGKRIGMLFCTWVICYLFVSLIVGLLLASELTTAKLTVALVLQQVLLFIAPAIITAVVISRRPAELMMINRRPGIANILIVFMILVASMPVMNEIIAWNQSMTLPDSMAEVERWMRETEQSAADSIGLITSIPSVDGLILSILLLGFMAGFSEELFFRGSLQRIISTSSVGRHAAVWITAFIFSAVHLQFFGFVPRLLLGAFFGYLALWSGSLWLAIAGHMLNNSMAAILMWIKLRSGGAYDIEAATTTATGGGSMILLCSAVFTILWIVILYARLNRQRRGGGLQ